MNVADGKQAHQGKPQADPSNKDATNPPSPGDKPSRNELIQQYKEEALQHPKKLFACLDAVFGDIFEVQVKLNAVTMRALARIAENDPDMHEVGEILSPYIEFWREMTRYANLRHQFENSE
jgi:hypothetical protein